jgi:imidazole glycerol-phosphate synthase subunit HisH
MKIAIVDYGAGNLQSAHKAFERAARDSGIAAEVIVTDDPDAIARADRIVLPGQGAFADCMNGLAARAGVIAALTRAVREQGKPFFGICVGMQLLAARGLEHGEHAGLGWLGGEVRRLDPADAALKIPHMGWNELECADHPLTRGVARGAHAYFVHSYHYVTGPGERDAVIAVTDYGGPVIAMVARGNIAGAQFHPEKSQATGLALIRNFLAWLP